MTNLDDNAVWAAVANTIQDHPAVVEALIAPHADGAGSTAWIVPDPQAAPVLHRSAVMEDEGRLGVLAWHEPSRSLRVAGLNRGETDFLYREIFTDGVYFRRGMELPPDAVVVDVGANIGMFSLHIAQRSPGARIVAIEPVAELADAIRINADLHGAAVTVMCAAAGSTESEAAFTFYRHNSVMSGQFADSAADIAVLKGYLLTGHGSVESAQLDRMAADRMVARQRRVPVVTLARVVLDLGIEHIDLLKIDVEKAEAEVLAGIDGALWARIDRVVMEVHDMDGRLDAVLGLLRVKGFIVESDQDPRLVLTPCHTVYARRPGPVAVPSVSADETPVPAYPTLRELERELRQLVTQRHPSAEQPTHFVLVTDLVRAGSRAGMPVPRPGATRRTVALAAAWATIFGTEAVRAEADFFDLGGDSLTALRLLDRVDEELGEGAVTPEMIFASSTFGALAAAIEANAVDPFGAVQ